MSQLDTAVFLWLNATANSPAWLVPLARMASQELPQWLVAGAVGAFLTGGMPVRRTVLRVLAAMAIAWLLARLGQHLFPAPRPFSLGLGTPWLAHGDSASFPSTHASVAFAFAGVVAASTRRWVPAATALALAGVVAWSRVCLGLHFPTDVLVGAAIGGASAWLSGLVRFTVPNVRPAL